jgi:hypothetical protein
MKKIVWKYGLLSVLILGLGMTYSVIRCLDGHIDASGQIIGYTVMVLAFIAVFFGVRAYREENGGTITFGRALKVGLLITLVVCAVYVIGWEIAFWGFIPDFGERYAAGTIAKMQSSGASAAEIAKARTEMAQFVQLYKNPLFNIGMTFLEIFPVGLIMALISAAILRRKTPPPQRAAVATA